MKKLSNSAIVVITSRNAEKWTKQCVQSVLEQSHKDLGIIFIDDCSGDKTYEVASGLLANKPDAVVISRTDRRYAMENIDYAIREFCSNPDSVIFLVDGDDWLACPTAIGEMMEQHKTADVVWSRYQCTNGVGSCCGPLTDNDIRHHGWNTSHLRSFKKFLFDAINSKDFLDVDGKPYRMTWDMAIMMPILEQVPPNRRRFYGRVLYTYNRDNPNNDDKTNRDEQKRMDARIRSQKPYSLHPRYVL
jgi:glycosyltransferase involved in cell wall biosynthesis